MKLSGSDIHLYAAKPLCAADSLGRACRCDRCIAILACRMLLDWLAEATAA